MGIRELLVAETCEVLGLVEGCGHEKIKTAQSLQNRVGEDAHFTIESCIPKI